MFAIICCLTRHQLSAADKHVGLGCAQVLAAYPTTIRRRILRHLYLHHVRASYIFQGCRQKFLDALLGISKVIAPAMRGLWRCLTGHGGRLWQEECWVLS